MTDELSPNPAPPLSGRENDDMWERWQRGVVQFLVLALKIISAAAIITLFVIAEYAAVRSAAHALAMETVNAAPQPKAPAPCEGERPALKGHARARANKDRLARKRQTRNGACIK